MPTKKQIKRAEKLKRKAELEAKYPPWTMSQKIEEVLKIKSKLIELGLGVYEEEMKRFSDICQAYIKEGVECSDKIKFPESKRVLHFMFKNSSKHKINSQLLYDEHV